ncbi:MAG: peptidoglycan-binding protein, partial [Candidatus Electrothrix sp. AR5]|nr:peptidoglycan-binding protein [Candidatus Electrothrix sp. AR5]
MIRLGCFDAGVTQNTLDAYVKLVQQTTRVSVNEIKEGSDKLFFREFIPDKRQPMTITEVQQSLRDLGFFPGGLVNGICGYRTLSAIRLFQEYVRTRDKLPSVPDGIFGPNTLGHLRRWIDRPEATEWASKIKQWQDGTSGESEYTQWLTLLTKVKSQYTAKPNRMLQKVNEYVGNTDTKKVADWEF